MAQDLGIDFAAGPSITFPTGDISDGADSNVFPSGGIDFGNPGPVEVGFEWKSANTVSGVGPVYLYVCWSHDNTDFADEDNGEQIAVVTMNGTTEVRAVGSFRCRAQYAKFVIHNESGGTYDVSASGLVVWDMFGNQV